MSIRSFAVGESARTRKLFSQEEVAYYCRHISGDSNPIHTDPAYAAKTVFKKCIVPGIMATSLFGGILGSTLPGKGTIQLGQTSKFIKPVFIGEEVEAVIEITHIREDKPVITFSTKLYNNSNELLIDGEAVVMIRAEI
jgi:enoyl-CoA hydratase